MRHRIAQVVVGLPLEGPFDYIVSESCQERIGVGRRVSIPFANKKRIGFIIGLKSKSQYRKAKLKSIFSVIDSQPLLSRNMLALTQKVARYYGCSWGEAIETSLPRTLRSTKGIELSVPGSQDQDKSGLEETVLLHDLEKQKSWNFLFDQIKQTLALGKSVIFLVPEVVLIDKIRTCLKSQYPEEIAIIDKQLSSSKELLSWKAAKEGRVKLVVGTRSAIFTPVDKLGLIIVYDEENPAYKQDQTPFYNGRDVALMRAKMDSCRVILVSAMPSPEIWWQASKKRIKKIQCEPARMADLQVIDLANYKMRKQTIIATPLRNRIQKCIENRGKTILFLNRKGFSTLTRCHHCQYTLRCPRCETNLVYLYEKRKMVCSQCNYKIAAPDVCPQCKSSYLRSSGIGTEKLESELAREFPQCRICRYDKEIPKAPEDFDILITTQAILREYGRMFVDLIGVIQIDSQLNRADFRAAYRVFSLLAHLRQMALEKVLVQTRFQDNYCIAAAQKMDIKNFYSKEIKFRRELDLPPFRHLVSVIIRGPKESVAFEQANILYKQMQTAKIKESFDILEPQEDIIPKLRGKYRFIILMKGKTTESMISFIRNSIKASKRKSGAVISVNVDP